jgi:hypothetical protein
MLTVVVPERFLELDCDRLHDRSSSKAKGTLLESKPTLNDQGNRKFAPAAYA